MNLPTHNNDPRQTILTSPMGLLQLIVVTIAVGLNALDGFDVMSISFASIGIQKEWHIDKATLGAVLSMELIGMAAGSILLGGLADRIGRRRTVLGCLILMTTGMFMATRSGGVVELSCWRVLTGLGIGGVLAAVNAITAEFANARSRDACVSFMSIGYPLGAVFGGVIVAQLLKTHDWRSVFYFGAAFTATLIPIVWFLVPESVHWLARKQPADALGRINRAMKRMGFAAIDSLPPQVVKAARGSIWDIFAPALMATTVILTIAYFFHVTTFYFILKWVPSIIASMGFPASSAAGVLTWANVGGAAGGALFGVLTQKLSLKPLTIVTMVLATVGVIIFGHTPANLDRLSLLCAGAGFFGNAGIVGMYAIFARAYPTHVRAFGTGWAIGVGRGGAALAPWVAGILFKNGHPVPEVAFVMAMGSLVAACALLFLKLRSDEVDSEEQPVAAPAAVSAVPGATAA
ncbi:MAG TPA: MFS transporter [Steroidobacteraceae bacterium]|nr:MFS transporter [Steroidobacteraceae bacterium]